MFLCTLYMLIKFCAILEYVILSEKHKGKVKKTNFTLQKINSCIDRLWKVMPFFTISFFGEIYVDASNTCFTDLWLCYSLKVFCLFFG